MRASRHLLAVVVASLPLLALVVVAALEQGTRTVAAAVALWLVGVAVLAGWLWRETLRPLADLLSELDTPAPQQARWRLREVKEQLELLRAREAAAALLLEDVALRLGEGLLVVGSDLKVRLANPRALHFLGRETVSPGTPLVDLLRHPDAVDAVRRAASGQTGARVLVENPRGLWELHAAPVHGGAVVLATEVGLLQRSAELRQRFVQDLSHELRSPLTVMRTTVEAMEGEVSPQLAEMLVRQVERTTRLVDELYELATIEAGQVNLRPEPFHLHEAVEEVLGDFFTPAAAAGISLCHDVPADLVLTCDRRGLQRVLNNLVDNAVKYNRQGGRVEVRGWAAGGTVTVEVSDTGEGIPAGELGAVMQRFYRRDRARTPGQGGLGLGLAIVKHLVQQMGGTTTLDSREGVGTRVTVSLPATPRPA